MNLRDKAAAYGLGALALALGVILAGTLSGLLQVSSIGLNPGSPAEVSIMLTDPPSIPAGVTGVYVTYSDVGIHLTGLGDAGWIYTGSSGTLETTGLVNLSQTIASVKVPSGRYNLVLFNVTSAKVTYNGANYSAVVNHGRLIIPIAGGLELNSTKPGAALIDINPTVLNLGNKTDPDFVVSTVGGALQIPSGDVTPSFRHLGFRLGLEGRHWYREFLNNLISGVTVTGQSLSSSQYSFTLSDGSPNPVVVRLVLLTPHGSGGGPGRNTLSSSIVFFVLPNGTLQLFSSLRHRGLTPGDFRSILSESGYALSSGTSKTFTYSGVIDDLGGSALTSGSSYVVTVIGDQTLVSSSIVAA